MFYDEWLLLAVSNCCIIRARRIVSLMQVVRQDPYSHLMRNVWTSLKSKHTHKVDTVFSIFDEQNTYIFIYIYDDILNEHESDRDVVNFAAETMNDRGMRKRLYGTKARYSSLLSNVEQEPMSNWNAHTNSTCKSYGTALNREKTSSPKTSKQTSYMHLKMHTNLSLRRAHVYV